MAGEEPSLLETLRDESPGVGYPSHKSQPNQEEGSRLKYLYTGRKGQPSKGGVCDKREKRGVIKEVVLKQGNVRLDAS